MTSSDTSAGQKGANPRTGSDPFLSHRRGLVGLSLFSAGIMGDDALTERLT